MAAIVALAVFVSIRQRQPTIKGPALTGIARVLSLESSGLGGSDTTHGCKIGLRVEIPGRPHYDVTVRRRVHIIHLPRVQPGATIPVWVDATRPERVRIDFNQPIT